MFKIYLLLLILTFTNLFSQDIIKKYDKFENKFHLSLEDYIDLYVEDPSETLDFDINILKIYNSQDTSYYLKISAECRSKMMCSTLESKCVIVYDNNSIVLKHSNLDFEKKMFNLFNYHFDIRIQKQDLINLFSTKIIEIAIYCEDVELKGKFTEEDFEDFRKFIKNYVK